MSLERRILAFSRLGDAFTKIANILEDTSTLELPEAEPISIIQRQSSQANPWFDSENIAFAFRAWSKVLTEESLNTWLATYSSDTQEIKIEKKIALINAGNIPLVGFHDFLSVLISGHNYIAKNASDDSILLPYVGSILSEIEPAFKERIMFTDRLSNFDAVIATGSNNSSRYFNYYFGKYPHIIRKNRNGIAVFKGDENENFFGLLGEDIFRFYGLGCRNISKMYVPTGYNFDTFFKSIYNRNKVMQHNKYMNNFEHHNAVLLLKRIPFLQNGFLILMENEAIASPVAVLNYEFYKNAEQLKEKIRKQKDEIQCLITEVKELKSDPELKSIIVEPGKSQSPGLADYADGVDTIKFLNSLK